MTHVRRKNYFGTLRLFLKLKVNQNNMSHLPFIPFFFQWRHSSCLIKDGAINLPFFLNTFDVTLKENNCTDDIPFEWTFVFEHVSSWWKWMSSEHHHLNYICIEKERNTKIAFWAIPAKPLVYMIRKKSCTSLYD